MNQNKELMMTFINKDIIEKKENHIIFKKKGSKDILEKNKMIKNKMK